MDGGFLKIKGRQIVDERGHEVRLRGVGLGNWLLPEGYMWKFGPQGDRPRRIEAVIEKALGKAEAPAFWAAFRDRYITEADIRRIAELGFNLVRPALNYRTFEMDRLEALVAWCKKYNVYVLIDLHGAPGGQTGKNIDDSEFDKPELFHSGTHQGECIAWWESIARRFKDESAVCGYDLLNEPLPDDFADLKPQLEPLYKRITRAIRAIDTRHFISVEGSNWANNWSVFGRPFDSQMVYQFHKYWNDPDKASIQGYLEFQKRWDVPLLAGEFGESKVGSGWYWATGQLFEDMGVHWCFWPWKKLETESSPYSIRMPQGWDKIQAIADGRPAPPREEARGILNAFLENIKLANCVEQPEVARGLFRRVPGRVDAENYGHLGEGRSFHLKPRRGQSGEYRRTEPVPIENMAPAGFSVGWMEAGEWLEYDVEAPSAGMVEFSARMAALESGRRFHIERAAKDLSGPLEAPKTGSWERYEPKAFGSLYLEKGRNRVRFVSDSGGTNLDWMKFGAVTVEAEDYKAAMDKDPENRGGAYRPGEAVDIQELPGERRWAARLSQGEWLAFEVNVPREAEYRASVRSRGGSWSVKVDGKPLGRLKAGKHTLVLACEEGEGLVDCIEIQ